MLRRLGYIAFALIWLAIMFLPILALTVAIRGEMRVGDREKSHVRVFLIQSDEENGLGLEWSRNANDEPNCLETSVRYFLWDGDSRGADTNYCQCYEILDGRRIPERPC